MSATTRLQLWFMMFLQFFIWGAWFVSLGTFLELNLQADGRESAKIFSTQSWGAIIAPFIVGLIADRFFNAERILGALHLLGAALMYFMYQAEHVDSFYPYTFVYMILYMPTIALANSVAFRQLKNPDKEFSSIRMMGTIGWIVAGFLISYVFHWDSDVNKKAGMLQNTFLLAGTASLLLGLFSFTLPKTPPIRSKSGSVSLKEISGLNAIKLLADRNYLIFFIASILICIPLAFYYQLANSFLSNKGVENATGLMAWGQGSEVLFLLLLPYFFKRFGFKKTILAGMLAWVLRYVCFAFGDADSGFGLLLIGIVLHGICYDFFFVSGYIYTNQKAGEENKSAAQGLITLATYGVGMAAGFWIAGLVSDQYKSTANVFDYQSIWLIPAAIAAFVFLFFILLFRNESNKEKQNI
jgi:nucleoside transporter